MSEGFAFDSVSETGTLLATYRLPTGLRKVLGFDEADGIAVFDAAFEADGSEAYFVDRAFFWSEGLKSFVSEYVRHACRIGCVPVSKAGVEAAVFPPLIDGEGVAVAEEKGTGSEEEG